MSSRGEAIYDQAGGLHLLAPSARPPLVARPRLHKQSLLSLTSRLSECACSSNAYVTTSCVTQKSHYYEFLKLTKFDVFPFISICLLKRLELLLLLYK